MLNNTRHFAQYQKIIRDPDMNKYQENQMLFFQDNKAKHNGKKTDIARPRTISEIKKLKQFVRD